MNPTLALILAISAEVIATTALKLSEGFSRLVPSVFVVVGYAAAFYFLSLALRTIPLGVAYAVWSAVGTVAIALIGALAWKQSLNVPTLIGIALIIGGVVLVNLFAEGAHAA